MFPVIARTKRRLKRKWKVRRGFVDVEDGGEGNMLAKSSLASKQVRLPTMAFAATYQDLPKLGRHS